MDDTLPLYKSIPAHRQRRIKRLTWLTVFAAVAYVCVYAATSTKDWERSTEITPNPSGRHLLNHHHKKKHEEESSAESGEIADEPGHHSDGGEGEGGHHHHSCKGHSKPIADPFDFDQKPTVVLYLLGMCYMFLALAMVCEEYFVAALNEIIVKLEMSPDVAGATLMAAGSSSPEVFAALVGVFLAESNEVGTGTVVGSAVFNMLIIVGAAAVLSPSGVTLEARSMARDVFFYTISILILLWVFWDNEVEWYEALICILSYALYIIVCVKWENLVKMYCPIGPRWKKPSQEPQSPSKPPPTLKRQSTMDMVKSIVGHESAKDYLLLMKTRRGIVGNFFGVDASAMATAPRAQGERELRAMHRNRQRRRTIQESDITMAERTEAERAFKMFDKDNKGYVGLKDVKRAFREMKVDFSTYEDQFMDLMDRNQDGKIDKNDFIPLFAEWSRLKNLAAANHVDERHRGTAKAKFKALDLTDSGTLTQKDMQLAIQGAKTTEEKKVLEDMASVFDLKKGESMTFSEFLTVFSLYHLETIDSAVVEKAHQKHLNEVEKLALVTKQASEYEEEHGHVLWRWPDGWVHRIEYVVGLPLSVLFTYTIVDCRRKKYRNYAMATFMLSIMWLGIIVFFMIEWAEKAGCLIGINKSVMGLTICAAGTSTPDALASIFVAREGKGTMAVSNAFGSNIFDILFGLGLPWFLKTCIVSPGEKIDLGENEITEAVYLLFGLLAFYLIAVIGMRLKVARPLGYLFIVLYLVFIIWSFLDDYGVI